jgi:diguanylate cyclase (GGDEF)-like protein/PAS domain S-box-containing protein
VRKKSDNKYSSDGICRHERVRQRGTLYRAMAWEFLKIIFPLVLISALGAVVFQIQSYRSEVEDLRVHGEASVRSSGELIYSDFQDTTADLRVLAASTAVRKMLESGGHQAIEDVANDFMAFSANKQKYDQIRYIDAQGMERIRINYNGGQPSIVPAEQLQNKADRYYFQDTMSLSRGEIFVSPLDLNIENGKLEQPRKPMIRFGMPLYDSAGNKRGVLIINYLGDHFLGHLRNVPDFRVSEAMLLSAEGYWLLAPNPEDEWGFMYKNGRRFQNRFPAAWQAFHQQERGAYQDDTGIFAYTAIRPMLEGQSSSTGASEAYAPSTGIRAPRDYAWTLVSYIPAKVLALKQARRWQIGLLQYGLLLLVLIPLTLAFSWAHVRRRAADSQIERLEQRMRDITRSLAVGLFVLDQNGRLSMMNPEAERLLGWTETELCGEEVHDLILPELESDAAGELKNGFVLQEHSRNDDLFQRKDGSSFHAAYVVSPLLIAEQPAGTVVSFQDISERKRMEREMERMATQDELTGLYNRRELNKRLEEELRRAERYDQYFSVWMLDIDHFKQINDTFGHQDGDTVLKVLAENLKQMLRDTDIVARFGGEEFTAILAHTDLELAMQMAERVRAEMAEMAVGPNHDNRLSVTVSIGVAAYPMHGTTAEDLIRAADQGLYVAKQEGRNRVRSI